MSLHARIGWGVAIGVLVAGTLIAAPHPSQAPQIRFPHDKHARVFPQCSTCHAGVADPSQSIWPASAACGACHDGVVSARITWEPRSGPRPGNRRFTHEAHRIAVTANDPADSTMMQNCASCHNEAGAPRMTVRSAVVENCLDCHGFTAPHVDVPGDACATCHVPLTDAGSLTRADIARFPKPQSHASADWLLGGHGKLARVPGSSASAVMITPSCATCHSRNLCLTCHVNAPESPVIQALSLDDRPRAYVTTQPVPPSHAGAGFLRAHGREASRPSATCATCHARESCTTCHIGVPPRAIANLFSAGPERAPGAQLTRVPPSTHTQEFTREAHGAQANARPATCETCHTRGTCLQCHRPAGTRETRYHPQGFVTRHPTSAYAREANCSDCHNPSQFCQSCHQQAGLVATARIGRTGYHDAFRGFSLGHGQAARQSLESCASCHAERDCTACHSAVGGGFRFSPHGPGFNAARARSKNPSVCIACHGSAIPRGG